MKKIILGCISMSIVLLCCVNSFFRYSWRLFFHDVMNLFNDNKNYLLHFLIPIFLFSSCVVLVVYWILEQKMVFHYTIRCNKKIWKVNLYKLLKRCAGKIYICVIAVSVLIFVYNTVDFISIKGKKGWTGDLTIAHAGGMYDDNYYLNCLEAIEYNYEKGHRTFEIDFSITSDNKMVCKHDWDYTMQEGNESGEVWDEETFLSVPLFGKYTPISFADLCKIMESHPDMWLVTDTKDAEEDLVRRDFEIMVSTARELNMESVLDRIVVQIYNEEMYDVVKEVYPFRDWIYTLYQFFGGDEETFQDCVRFCYNNNIENITTWNYLMTSDLLKIAEEYNISVYVHTENDIENAMKLKKEGVTGFYTDVLTPDMLKED